MSQQLLSFCSQYRFSIGERDLIQSFCYQMTFQTCRRIDFDRKGFRPLVYDSWQVTVMREGYRAFPSQYMYFPKAKHFAKRGSSFFGDRFRLVDRRLVGSHSKTVHGDTYLNSCIGLRIFGMFRSRWD